MASPHSTHATSPQAPPQGTPLVARPMTDADIAAVVEMERDACPHPLHAWTPENYRSSLRAGYWAVVRCEPRTQRIVAVCVAMDGVDEVHLLNIAVARDCQGRGLARELIHVLVDRCRQRRATALWLEVRPSNERARTLYRSEGFDDIGVRRNYYPAATGREDALVMRREVALPEASDALD